MTTDKATVQVEIYGQYYSVHAGADPEYVKEIAAYVDKKMRAVSQSSSAVDSMRAAVLAALNLADECFRLRQEQGDPSLFRKRTEALIHQLDVVIKE